jgi:hypothetical protein
MKSKSARHMLLILALLLTQAASAAPPARAVEVNNPSAVAHRQHGGHVGIPYNRACRRRCERDYNRCVRRGRNRTACRRQLRNCLRRCPQ